MCQQGLSTSTLASSFGKVITSKKKLTDYKPEDLASTLLSAFTYNIAQVSSFFSACLLVINIDFLPWNKDTVRVRVPSAGEGGGRTINYVSYLHLMTPNILY
jgi:pantothenate kinase